MVCLVFLQTLVAIFWSQTTFGAIFAQMFSDFAQFFYGFCQEFWPGLRSRKASKIFGWSRIFCPTLDVQLVYFLNYTLKLGIPVEMVVSFVETEVCCCAPRFPLILTAKFHSFCVKESERPESEILERRSRKSWKGRSRIFYLQLRNHGFDKSKLLGMRLHPSTPPPTSLHPAVEILTLAGLDWVEG